MSLTTLPMTSHQTNGKWRGNYYYIAKSVGVKSQIKSPLPWALLVEQPVYSLMHIVHNFRRFTGGKNLELSLAIYVLHTTIKLLADGSKKEYYVCLRFYKAK